MTDETHSANPQPFPDDQPTLTIEIPLDEFHVDLNDTLQDNGVDTETVVAGHIRQQAESVLYQTFQDLKYNGGQ